jgi:hypothetical protein
LRATPCLTKLGSTSRNAAKNLPTNRSASG